MASAVPASSTYTPNIVFGTSNMNFLKHRYINMIKTPPYVSFKKIKMRTCCIEIRKKIYFQRAMFKKCSPKRSRSPSPASSSNNNRLTANSLQPPTINYKRSHSADGRMTANLELPEVERKLSSSSCKIAADSDPPPSRGIIQSWLKMFKDAKKETWEER